MTVRWIETHKGDVRARELADRHYTRQTVGHPMFTRPGWNQVLIAEQANGRRAAFVWWRPKWEAGIPGTARKDGMSCIECTLFRNETRFRSSDLIRDAVACLLSWEHAQDVAWPDGIITGVSSSATVGGRAPSSPAGMCFIAAGWAPFAHAGRRKRADVWLRHAEPLPTPRVPEKTPELLALLARRR